MFTKGYIHGYGSKPWTPNSKTKIAGKLMFISLTLIGVDKDAISESVPSTSRPGSGTLRNSGVSLGPLSTCSMTCKGRICTKPLSLVVKTHLKTVLCGQNNVTNQRFGNGFIAPIIALHTCRNMESNCPSELAFKPSILGWYPPTQPPFFLVQPSGELQHDTPSFFLVQPIFLLENN